MTLSLAQNFDGHRTAPNTTTTTAEVIKHDLNGGYSAVALWALPLVAAIALILGLIWIKFWRQQH